MSTLLTMLDEVFRLMWLFDQLATICLYFTVQIIEEY